MHTEYRILNIIVSIENGKPSILSDIAIFNVDKANKVNEFVGIVKQVSSRYPYIQELSIKNNTEVVILDDIQYNGDLKQLLKKNSHLVMRDTDYKYKDYVYVVCKLDVDSYLIYTCRNNMEIVSFSDLSMYDEVGRLFNASLVTGKSRGKEVHKVITGTNINDTKKRVQGVELREFKCGEQITGKKGRFALDMVNLKTNPNLTDLIIIDGHLERFTLTSYDSNYSFKLPPSVTELLASGRKYKITGMYDTIDLSDVHILNKNSLEIKCECKNLILSEDMCTSSNLDFLVYSLKQYTGELDYSIDNLIIKNITSSDVLDLTIRLLAELRFNTDFESSVLESFPIRHITFTGDLIDAHKKLQLNGVEDPYRHWINEGLTRFSVSLLENYSKAVGYYKKASAKLGKTLSDLSIQTLELLSDYESNLCEAIKFFNFASVIYFDVNSADTKVHDSLYNFIAQITEERTDSKNNNKKDFIDDVLNKLG